MAMEDPLIRSSSASEAVRAVRGPGVVVRDIRSTAELHTVEDLQREVWGIPDLDVIPLTHLIAVQTAGGVLVGAFDDDELVGFVYGFAAIENGETTHHSHMLAVKSDHRGAHIGERLKLAQRERVLAQGIKTVSWTFDPLRSKNAHLNFRKLGVTCSRYLVDLYGDDAASYLHRSGTDRFWVTWDVASRGVEDRIAGRSPSPSLEKLPILLAVGSDERPILESSVDLSVSSALIEIPSNFLNIEAQSSHITLEWRYAVRRALSDAIDAGYTVTDFVRGDGKGSYVLSRDLA